MNVSIIWDADYPWDVRVEKIAKSLQENGHSVHILARNLGRARRIEEIDGFTVHRLPSLPLQMLSYMLQFPYFLNPIWICEILKITRNVKADVMIVRDLPLAPTGLAIGRLLKIPTIFDMAENYPLMLAAAQSQGRKRLFSDILLRNPFLALVIEDFVLPRMDHIMVVVEESKNRLTEKGVDPEKISIVSNTPNLSSIGCANVECKHRALVDKLTKQYSIVYHGNIQPSRGLDSVILALPRLISQDIDAHLYVFGTGETHHLRPTIERLQLFDNVHFMGWWRLQDIMAVVKYAKVGVIPHLKTSHTDTTVPNKLFDYMALGLPVIVSNTAPMSRIVRESDCGVVFTSEDVISLEAALLKFNNDSREEYGVRGKEAVKKRYNWDIDSKNLLRAVESYDK